MMQQTEVLSGLSILRFWHKNGNALLFVQLLLFKGVCQNLGCFNISYRPTKFWYHFTSSGRYWRLWRTSLKVEEQYNNTQSRCDSQREGKCGGRWWGQLFDVNGTHPVLCPDSICGFISVLWRTFILYLYTIDEYLYIIDENLRAALHHGFFLNDKPWMKISVVFNGPLQIIEGFYYR